MKISLALSNPFHPESFHLTKRKHRCDLCDMKKATKYSIPACKRPAAYWAWDAMFGVMWKLYVCKTHFRELTARFRV